MTIYRRRKRAVAQAAADVNRKPNAVATEVAIPTVTEIEALPCDLRMAALGLLSHAEGVWDDLARAA
jgi:hypothetical protein